MNNLRDMMGVKKIERIRNVFDVYKGVDKSNESIMTLYNYIKTMGENSIL